jgi:aminoglycoside 3-N-acetyltransferase
VTDDVARQLAELGVSPGGVLVVHTAFSKLRGVAGGPRALIAALESLLGPGGTLVMPSMSDDDELPFDPRATPCRGMGIVAETFWQLDGVLRSDSPHSFAAKGPRAAAITAPHRIDVPHGLDSPVGRAFAFDAEVLLLGVGHDANTTVHLAENLAGVRYGKATHATEWADAPEGRRAVRRDYVEVDHCCKNFEKLDGWLAPSRQRLGRVGGGEARLMRARDVVDAVLARLSDDETVLLHAPGDCEECDAALELARSRGL